MVQTIMVDQTMVAEINAAKNLSAIVTKMSQIGLAFAVHDASVVSSGTTEKAASHRAQKLIKITEVQYNELMALAVQTTKYTFNVFPFGYERVATKAGYLSFLEWVSLKSPDEICFTGVGGQTYFKQPPTTVVR